MEEDILKLLRDAHEIAVVGISNKPDRPSYGVSAYLQEQGYRIVPINPALAEVLGEKCYPTLTACGKSVDIVDIFRRPEEVPPVVEEAISTGARAVWMQEGIRNDEAAKRASDAGLLVVQDRCILKVLASLGGRP